MALLTDEGRLALEAVGHSIRYTAGSILFGEGEETDFTLGEVEALYVSGRVWREFLYTHPRVMHALLQSMSRRIRESTGKMADSHLGVERRLARGLVELAEKIGDRAGDEITIGPLSQREVAGLIRASRESVSHVIRALRERNVLSTGRQRIVVHDLEVLRKIAAGDLPSHTDV